MARAGQRSEGEDGGLADRVSVGGLARCFPRVLVEAVVEESGAREKRVRLLPAWLVVYYVLALALFMDRGGARVMRQLAGTIAWAGRGVAVAVPSEEALSNARGRLGPEPLRLLFERAAGPLAAPGAVGAFWRGLRLVSVDGTTLDVQDTPANWERYGGPETRTPGGERLRGGFPQVRVVALAECGPRALIGAAVGRFTDGEKTLAVGVLKHLDGQMLVLADRNFAGWQLWRDAAATGAALLWRMGSAFPLPVEEVLDDGTYLSRLNVPSHLPKELRRGAAPIPVRVVEYRLEDADGSPGETFVLATTLTDPAEAPAGELAGLYHRRWEIETALGALKSGLKGDRVVLRSKTPDGAEQECWALLCAYHAIRDVLCAAAELAAQDPLRLSFVNALDAVRGQVGDPAGTPPLTIRRPCSPGRCCCSWPPR